MSAQEWREERDVRQAEELVRAHAAIRAEIGRVIVGQERVIEELLTSLFTSGHCLLIGVPGLAKTLLVATLAQALHLSFNRVQFTPDLMPSDITGTEVLEEDAERRRSFRFIKGPVFTNVLLADEINRTPPKTQAALLEAMEELQVTVQGVTYPMDRPFFVLATQNPIELEGTYPLPEAQLDRFMFNIIIDYLGEEDELKVVAATTTLQDVDLARAVTGREILEFQRLVRRVPVPEHVSRYAVSLVRASRPVTDGAPAFVREWIDWGASLRASQYLVLGAKARALLSGRFNASIEDIQALAYPVMRHRILTNFHAESQKVTKDEIIRRLLETVPVPKSGL